MSFDTRSGGADSEGELERREIRCVIDMPIILHNGQETVVEFFFGRSVVKRALGDPVKEGKV